MRLKRAVSQIEPKMNEHGFFWDKTLPRDYRFVNDTAKMLFTISVPPRCPPYLFGPYLENLKKTMNGDTDAVKYKYVTFMYSAKLPNGGYINLDPYMFEDCMDVLGDFLYTNEQELMERLHYVVDESFSIVIPYLDRLRARYVCPEASDELTGLLSGDPSDLARKVISRFDLPEDRHTGYERIEPVLVALRGPDESKWRGNFFENLESIAGLAAYLSECIAERSASTGWYMETTPEIQTYERLYPSRQSLYFSALYKDNREEDFNLLEIIREIWNYSPHVKCKHINQIIERIQ